MSLGDLLRYLESMRTGAVVPMSAGGVPIESAPPAPRSLADVINARRYINPNQSTTIYPPPAGPRG